MARDLTVSEHLYLQFKNADTDEVRAEFRARLFGICKKAVGHLVPPWRGPWHPDFLALRYKARDPWIFRWLDNEVAKPLKDGGQYIGRRCRIALIKEIDRHRREKLKEDDGEDFTPLTPEQLRAYHVERRVELMATLGVLMRHATKVTTLDSLEKSIAFDSIMAGKPVKNVTLAVQYGCSEGQIRKKKKSLFAKLKRAKDLQRRHWELKQKRARRAGFKGWAKSARRDKSVWWDRPEVTVFRKSVFFPGPTRR